MSAVDVGVLNVACGGVVSSSVVGASEAWGDPVVGDVARTDDEVGNYSVKGSAGPDLEETL